ncbi:hypothetical protein QTP70_030814 [Hemibagrus guttatus]|uniref:C-type lectin domain-containing protein n=1 Tax=Hemibagrus guttatus TaxID=175788 RepID=A0AAE0RLD8_9TELE|nr:hypothetical protein QTP70_030814 [Hemibagrus guttatus]KAK3575572.1 hypothetical protein QTP86_030437 [Hemibagrus guttatus]
MAVISNNEDMIKFRGARWLSESKTGNARYIYNSVKKTWYDAQSYCRQYHTDLAQNSQLYMTRQHLYHFTLGLVCTETHGNGSTKPTSLPSPGCLEAQIML